MSKGSTTTQAVVPEFQQQMYRDIYGQATGIAQQPFIPYTGPQVAGFSPDELRAFGATRQQFGRAQQFDPFAQRQQLMQQPAPSLLGADISAYRSPFEQQVVDVALGDIQRQQDIAQQRAQEQAIRAGAFGGSRGAILEAEAARPYAEQVARVAPQLRQAGFEQAQRAAESDIERQLRQQQFQAGLIGQQEQAQRAAVSGLLGTGAQQRALQQQALGAGRAEFERALQYPYQQFGLLSQAISGIPSQMGQYQKQKAGTGDYLGTALQLGTLLFSDARLKDNIELIGQENGFNVYQWDWNDKAKALGINQPNKGLIAQEIQETNPEAVVKDDSGYLMINYGALA